MIGFYNYTVILTYLSLASSVFGIISAFRGNVFLSIFCLLFSGLCDGFDGKVARTRKKSTKDEKTFGMELDSLVDVICFGVLPAVIGYAVGVNKIIYIPILVFFVLAAVIRLAYFNMLEINRNSDKPVKAYTGLPVTGASLIFPFIYIFRKVMQKRFHHLYALTLLVVGLLFISKIKVTKPTMKTLVLLIVLGLIEILAIVLWFKLS